jgi:release factor glutamine methyltransferase
MNIEAWLRKSRKVYSDTDLRFLVKNVFLKESIAFLAVNEEISSEKLQALDTIEALYVQGMPLAYILGKEEFFGLSFQVDKRTLIPRKETELIVEKAVDIIESNDAAYVLDLCCGCANIAIAIDKTSGKKVKVIASDISAKALEVAARNKLLSGSSIELVETDLLSAFGKEVFDIIVSNPPYVERQEVKGALDYEPAIALDGGIDGLDYIRRIINEAKLHLSPKGFIVLEFGYRHKLPVEEMVSKDGNYEIREWIRDYCGHWRGVVLGKKCC